jgi:intracellular septation protein
MIAAPIALVVGYALTRRFAIMPLVTLVVVLIFGGLTLLLEDELFIKLKPTIVNLLFAATLLGGLAMGKSLIKVVLDQAFQLTDEGWRKLTLRWGLFFILLAIVNEVVWRNFDTDTWVAFKVWGIMPLTILFGVFQLPLLMAHELKTEDDKPQV